MTVNPVITVEEIPGVPEKRYSQSTIDLIKKQCCPKATDQELSFFLYVASRVGLDPLLKQIHAVHREDKKTGKSTMTIQAGIDGLRLIADRTRNYAPGKEPTFTYKDNLLVSATSYLRKMTQDGTWHDVCSTCFMSEYFPEWYNPFWKRMPHVMLSKCAEANALRKAFPAEMCGLYISEEMDQADNPIVLDEKEAENQLNQVVCSFEGKDKELILDYLNSYAKHHKKTLHAAVQDYADFDKLLKHFNHWKQKHQKVA